MSCKEIRQPDDWAPNGVRDLANKEKAAAWLPLNPDRLSYLELGGGGGAPGGGGGMSESAALLLPRNVRG